MPVFSRTCHFSGKALNNTSEQSEESLSLASLRCFATLKHDRFAVFLRCLVAALARHDNAGVFTYLSLPLAPSAFKQG